MKYNKEYTVDEKIKYYQRKVINLEFALENAQNRLHQLMEESQNWDESLSKQIKQKRKAR